MVWHIQEINLIMSKMIDDYGYDVLLNRKKCSALCADLLSRYTAEQKVLKMLFHEGLGEALSNAPYETEHELKLGVLSVEKFLKQMAINREARAYVIEIVQEVFSVDGLQRVENPFRDEDPYYDAPIETTVTKSFEGLHFKMFLPQIKVFVDRTDFTFKYVHIPSESPANTVLEKCVLIDKLKSTESVDDYCFFQAGETKNVTISIPAGQNKVIFTNSRLDFVFLCSNGKKVTTSYRIDSSKKCMLEQIEICQMSTEELKREKDLFNKFQNNTEEVHFEDDLYNEPIIDVNTLPKLVPDIEYPEITEFSDALRKEILFLKQGKGKKYKIVNGTKINRDGKGVYTYTFEMETELHLPDDAPVIIDTTSGLHAVGTVLLCEDFQIMLLVDRDLNDRVNAAYLMVEPWKLLEALDERMHAINPNVNRLAVRLMEDGPKYATTQDISHVPMGQDKVADMIADEDIVTVWGPPGTGKTYTMAKLAIDYIKQGKTVLIVSHSNVSVDGVVKKVVDMIDSNMQSYLDNGKILRFGYVRDDELSKHPLATSFNYTLNKCPTLANELERFTTKRDELKAKNMIKTAEYDAVEKNIKKVRDEIRKEERTYVEKAQLIGTTISRATIDPMFEEKQYDLVMFDEVSMAYVPQVIVAAGIAKEKFMCVGDFRQLAPIAQGPDGKKILQVDIFTYLKIIDGANKMYWHPWLVMLNEQRRMHPDIAEFPNKFVYKNLLKNHPSVVHGRDVIVNANPLDGDALNLINLHGTYCAASKNSDNSRFNILSALVSFSTAVNAAYTGSLSVGIITPYAAQTRLIRAMIRDYYPNGTSIISCATVHQFQGSESDVLIFDAVESYPTAKVGFLMGKVPSEVIRLINVAITRARGKLITVSNAKFWENVFKGQNHIYYRMLGHIQKDHCVIERANDGLKNYLVDVCPARNIIFFTREMDAINFFEADMNKASGKVLISIPDGHLHETNGQILDIIEAADSRGVDILMKSDNYKDLPDNWKRYCFGTENATFPLIIIDDEVAWYGLPTSDLTFQVDKNTTYKTVVQIIARIKGRNTIEMIKALTEIDTVEVGSNKRLLVRKENHVINPSVSMESGNMGSHGLAGFIEEKEYCSKCKSHMVLTKNKKGTSFLRCSNKVCDGMKYLDPDLMNWYIQTKNVMCPKKDGGELKGILGKFGPCVRCDCGHFLKPEEI